jgi:hypothetical protein
LLIAPGTSLRGQVFPLAKLGGPWGDIGIAASYVRIFSEDNDSGDATSDIHPTSYSAGLRARIHPGADPRIILGVSVEYAFTSFRSVGLTPFDLPEVTYRSVRSAVDARIPLGPVSILGGVAFHAIVDANAISTRFYNPSGYGLDAEIGGAFMFVRRVEARLLADYELYSFALAPPSVHSVAGSALDQFYGARLALGFVF